MPTLEDVEAKIAVIAKKKADTVKALQVRHAKLKAQLAELKRPTKSQRRTDARRKILLGAFVLEQLERTGASPQSFTFEGQSFLEWLVRPIDRAVFDAQPLSTTSKDSSPAAGTTTVTVLKVPFTAKDQAKALGALWQPEKKCWVVPAGRDLEPFKAWLE